MKGLADEPNYSIELLDGGVTILDVIDNHICEQTLTEKNAFFVADLGVIMQQFAHWQVHMSRVQPFYAVRCNSSPAVIEILASLGTGFICCNKRELALVQSYDIAPENIIYTGLCKQLAHIKYAAKNGIDLLVCDNETEMKKIARCHTSAKLLLQISTEAYSEGEATCLAFGSTLKSCRHLLECASELGLQVVGVKFHIPSSCSDVQAYTHAVADARCVFDMGAEFGFCMNILDIGGGFSGSVEQLEKINSALQPQLDAYFPPTSGVSIIAEPGAYYVSSAFTLAVNIISKKVVARDQRKQLLDNLSQDDEPEFLYYMNDGVYGSFACKLLENTIPTPSVHKTSMVGEILFSSSLWGPSCDGLDRVVEHCLLPELSVGDWLLFRNMGAHSLGEPAAMADTQRPPVYHVVSAQDWYGCMQDAGITLDTTMKNFILVPCFFPFTLREDAFFTPA